MRELIMPYYNSATSSLSGGDAYDLINRLDPSKKRLEREFDSFFIERNGLNDAATNSHHYLFFTSPDLPLTSQNFAKGGTADVNTLLTKNGNFLKLPGYGDSIYNKNIIDMLSGKNIFMPFFTNRAISFPASSENLDTLDYSETWNKYKIPIGSSTKDSRISGNFEIQFLEDQNITMLKTIKLWMDSIQAEFFGDVISGVATYPDLGNAYQSVIDYMSSIYHFATRADGRTLIYWSKYTGVFPTKNPWDVFQGSDSDQKIISEIGVDFQFAYKEDMEIAILNDFNLLSSGGSKELLMNPTGRYFYENKVDLVQAPNNAYASIVKKDSLDDNGNPIFFLNMIERGNPTVPDGYAYANYRTGNSKW